MSNVSTLCSKCIRLTPKSLEVRRVHYESYERLVEVAETCPMCRLMLAAIHRSNDKFDHEESRYYSTGLEVRQRYNSDGVSVVGGATPVFSLSLQLSNRDITCDKLTLSAELTVADQTSQTQNDLPVFAPPNTMVHLGFVEDPGGVQLKMIASDSRLEGEQKFSLMEDWLRNSDTPHYTTTEVDLTPNPESRTRRSTRFLHSILAKKGPAHSSGALQLKGNVPSPIISSRLPTRLIHIQGESQCDVGTLKLVLCNTSTMISDMDVTIKTPNYATLSHRWGSSNHFTTTKSNMDSRYKGFLISDLPQTYRDAVIVTWKLGLNLLWIDALCIVQDNAMDWALESEKMGDVYQKAHFTIAAHSAGNDEEGFLAAALRKRETVRLGGPRPFFVSLGPDLNADVTESQLCRRAWVLQERFLSPRIIHFTDGQLYWETVGEAYSEEGPIKLQSGNIADLKQFGPSATPELARFLHQDNPATSNRAMDTPLEWFRLVEMYARCGLTKEEDKLVAISGLAKRIHTKFNVGYLSGLWADRIHAGLLWMAEVEPLRKPQVLRAPSWSWASVDGPIHYPVGVMSPNFTPSCEILEVSPGFDHRVEFSFARGTTWMNGVGALALCSDMWDLSRNNLKLGKYTSPARKIVIEEVLLRPGQGPFDSALPSVENYQSRDDRNVKADFPDMHLNSYTRIRKIRTPETLSAWVAFDDEPEDQERRSFYYQQTSFHKRQLPNLCCALIGYSGVIATRVYYALFLISSGDSPDTFQRVGVGQLGHGLLRSPTWKNRKIVII